MFIIVGLGNPGSRYENTRHNIGFMLLDQIASEANVSLCQDRFQALTARGQWQGHDVFLAKPQTYMNLSGSSVQQMLSFYKLPIENLILAFDDLDQEVGAVKMRMGGGHGGHNGIRDILQKAPSDKFHRVKIGIGKPEFKSATADWVLSRFSAEEIKLFEENSFPTAKKRILDILKRS